MPFICLTSELRFLRRTAGGRSLVLQQAWKNQGDGSIEWRDVAIVDEPATESAPNPSDPPLSPQEKVDVLLDALTSIANDEMPVKGLAPGLYGHARRIAEDALEVYYDGAPPCPSCGATWAKNTRCHSTDCPVWPMSKGHETRPDIKP